MAAAELGITRQSVHERVRNSERLQAARIDIDETILDVAEGVMWQGILDKDLPTTRWLLDRKGRRRGYSPKTEIGGIDGGPIVVAAPMVELDSMPDEERELLRELLRRQRARQLGSAEGL